MRRALALSLLWSAAGTAAAEPAMAPRAALTRGVIAPRADAPQQVARGARLTVHVEVASALTPPPGVQTERALRGFGARLCALGVPIEAPAQLCTPLVVRNLRPLAPHSLAYRVELAVPAGLADGRYDLELRFPGGVDSVPGAVAIGSCCAGEQGSVRVERGGGELALRAPPDRPASARLHLGALGVRVDGARVDYFPRYADDGTFRAGSVAVVHLPPGAVARVVPLRGAAASRARSAPKLREAWVAQELGLELPFLPGVVYWWLSPEHTLFGARVHARFERPGRTRVEAIAFDAHGRSLRHELSVEVRPRLPSCAFAPPTRPPGARGLLLALLSWKLAFARRKRLASRPKATASGAKARVRC